MTDIFDKMMDLVDKIHMTRDYKRRWRLCEILRDSIDYLHNLCHITDEFTKAPSIESKVKILNAIRERLKEAFS